MAKPISLTMSSALELQQRMVDELPDILDWSIDIMKYKHVDLYGTSRPHVLEGNIVVRFECSYGGIRILEPFFFIGSDNEDTSKVLLLNERGQVVSNSVEPVTEAMTLLRGRTTSSLRKLLKF